MKFVLEKLERRVRELAPLRYRDVMPISSLRVADAPEARTPDDAERADGPPARVGMRWGGRDETRWFVGELIPPARWAGREVVGLVRLGDTGSGNCSGYEALVYVNGEPTQALDRNHEELLFPEEAIRPGAPLRLAIQAWSGLTPPNGDYTPFDHRIDRLEWGVLDAETDDLYYTAKHMVEAAKTLDDRAFERQALVAAVDGAFLRLDWGEPGSDAFYASVREALVELKARAAALPAAAGPRVTAVGHCHIDVAWLWRLKHTREKSARSFSTVLRLMEKYPEYVFFQSQPQLYAYLKEDYPDLYARIRERVAEGRWEASGAMWLEADCNIPSGESLVRQLVYGKRFFREEFGLDSRVLWLPDVFGYSWALPQLLKLSGIDYFMTTKISWNQYNRFPHDTFRWRGIDGTELLTHYITTPNNDDGGWYYTYNGDVNAPSVKGLWDNYRQKDVNDSLLMAYGWGDGGGGPTRDMLEAARRFERMPGLPSVRQGKAEAFFDELAARVGENPALPLWDGELYLEYHRGTYTSQAYNKRMNRRMEALLHAAEFAGVLASTLAPGFAYPKDLLREAWTIVLRNQFHDIIPGSSIREVYEDSREEYAEAQETAERALRLALEALDGAQAARAERASGPAEPGDGAAAASPPPVATEEAGREAGVGVGGAFASPGASAGEPIAYRVYNPLGWARAFPVELPLPAGGGTFAWTDADGRPLAAQRLPETAGSGGAALVRVPPVPAYGYAVVYARSSTGADAQEAAAAERALLVEPRRIETPFYRIALNEAGQLVSLYDKRAGREALKPGAAANALQVFEDKPLAHDAWDIDIFYQEKHTEVRELIECVVEEAGPLRGVLKLAWRYRGSRIEQRLIVYADHPRIDFAARVDWKERQQLLKAAFPVDIRSTKATYEIQFGNVERPTHWNTSWDWAKFESVAQRWVDLSEGGYGVSLLNDCKYGHDIRDHTIRLSLIKSAASPDPTADQGEHEFTYSLLPHEGGWLEAGTHQSACELNAPLIAVPADARTADRFPNRFGLIRCDKSHVMIDTVKKAEEGDDVIIRLYEFGGVRGRVRLYAHRKLADGAVVEATNLLEDDALESLAWVEEGEEERAVELYVKPYEIVTLRMRRSRHGRD